MAKSKKQKAKCQLEPEKLHQALGAVLVAEKRDKLLYAGQQESNDRQPCPPPVPDFASIIFSPIVGIEVDCLLKELGGKSDSKMFTDLFFAYEAALRNWKGESLGSQSSFLFLNQTLGKSILQLMRLFEAEFCSPDVKYCIRELEGNYFFVLIRVCDSNQEWNVIEAKKLLDSVKAKSKTLHDLTLSFLRSFINCLNIPSFYNGGFEMAEEFAREEIENTREETGYDFDHEMEDSRFAAMISDYNSYRIGKKAALGDKIRNSEALTADEIRERLTRIHKKHPVKEAIEAGLNLIEKGWNLSQFDGMQEVEDESEDCNECGLPYQEQFFVLHEFGDYYTESVQEWLDGRSSEGGIMPPVVLYKVAADREDWSREKFDNANQFPTELEKVFELLNAACNQPSQNLIDTLI